MWLRRAGPWILFLSFLATGCGGRGGPPPGPVVSPTGIVYEPGVPPVATRYSQTASLLMRQGLPERALELLQEGIEAEPGNPIHFYLAGAAQVELGNYEEADGLFTVAQRIYPAYELDIEPRRENAWAEAINAGLDAYGQGDLPATIEAWEAATLIFSLRPEAHRNLAGLLVGEGDYTRPIQLYREAIEGLARAPATRVLPEEELLERDAARFELQDALVELLLLTDRFEEAEPLLRRRLERDPDDINARSSLALTLTELEKAEEAQVIYAGLLADPEIESMVLFNLGVSLFRAERFEQAVEAFGALTARQPHSRDAWFNYTNSLYAAEAWERITEQGDRLRAADPLSESVGLITARAHFELGDEAEARRELDAVTATPVYLDGLHLRSSPDETVLQGRLIGNQAGSGASIRLRFVFFEGGEEAGAETLILAAPPAGEAEAFQLRHPGRASAYRYELLP